MQVDMGVVAVTALVISLASLLLSWRTAWHNSFRPAQLVGTLPHLAIWTLSSYKGDQPTGEVAERYLTPSFWLANVGAKEALIEDIRLCFRPTGDGPPFFAYPVSSVPIEAVESPSLFHEQNRLGLGGPFTGFCLSRSAIWKCSFAFSMSGDHWQRLRDDLRAEIQVRLGGRNAWSTILHEELAFGSQPIHLQGLRTGNLVAGSLVNHVVSRAWQERRAGSVARQVE